MKKFREYVESIDSDEDDFKSYNRRDSKREKKDWKQDRKNKEKNKYSSFDREDD